MSFEPGAPAANDSVPLCVPRLGGSAWDYVKACLDSNWVSSAGPFVDRFERMLADYVGAEEAVATVNGTAALQTALLVAGVEPDDEVLVSTLTFIASANSIRYANAWPVLIDAEPRHWQIDPQRVVDFIERDCRWRRGQLVDSTTERRVKAILPVHLLGHPVDIDPIVEVARKYDLVVVEDGAESLGARYRGRAVGTLGDIACFSFNGNKTITTGGGGMVVTNNSEWADRARYLTTQAKDDPIEYVHGEVGFNHRLTNIQAALGCAQMEQLGEHLAAKKTIASNYAREFDDIPGLTMPRAADWAESACWLSAVLVDETRAGTSSRGLLQRLAETRIQTRPLWQPMHRSPAHAANSIHRDCPVADRLWREALCLPSSVGIGDDQQRVIDAVKRIVRGKATSAA